jgi:hypothetical protein
MNLPSQLGSLLRSLSRGAAVLMVACAGLACTGLACAELGGTPALAQEPTPAAVAVARDVLIAKGAVAMADPLVRGVVESVKNSFVPTNPQLTRELNDVATVLQTEYEGKRSEIIDALARAYARHFTEQELKDLLLFYKTPLGKKFALEEPGAVEEGLRSAQDWGDTFSETVMARMRAEMRKKGHAL